MLRRLLIFLAVLAGLLLLADRGLAAVAANATASRIKLHEGLKEDPKVTFRGFPFVSQALHGRFRQVDVTVRDYARAGVTFDRIDASLEGVKVDLSDALKGRVTAVPVQRGHATVRVTYDALHAFLAHRPGDIRITPHDGRVWVRSTFGVAGAGQVEVEGSPRVRVTARSVTVTVTDVHAVTGARLTAAQAGAAATRASFTVPLSGLPFGIEVESAELTDDALVVTALASGLVLDVGR